MRKLLILFIGFLLTVCAVIIKLFFIQVTHSDLIAGSPVYLRTKKILPVRGGIFDKNGSPFTFTYTTYLLYAEPPKIKNISESVKKIDEVLHMGEATLEAKIKREKQWVPLAKSLTKEQKDALSRLKVEGIGFEEEPSRFYPEGSAAAHLLGFVGKTNEGENVGYFGLEGYYEKELTGISGIVKTERDLFGSPIFVGVQEKIDEEDGQNLTLTIDKTIQLITKNTALYGLERYRAKEVCITIADPFSLEIRALTCVPDYDPTKYYKFSEDFFRNPVISAVYEPGSILKPLIMATALDTGSVKVNDTYEEEGPVKVYDHEIRTWNNQYEGTITMTRILEKSSNVGMVFIGQKLDQQKLLSYLRSFGFNETTDIDLQGESKGSIKKEKEWYPIDYATVTFGQGIGVTQIQMIRALSSLINGGFIMKPFVVKSTDVSGSHKKNNEPKKIRRVVSAHTSSVIRGMLESTVEKGDAQWARPKGYKIGGKTGTAQVPVGKTYDPSKTIASFVGFAPVDKPRFIVLVTLKEPEASPWGSETAAPLFFKMVKELFIYYNIAPE